MPLSVAPVMRAIQEYREASGIYQTQDSVAVAERKIAEDAGTVKKVVPVAFVNIYEGVRYVAT